MKRSYLAVLVSSLLFSVGSPVFGDTPVRDHDIVLDDYFSIADIRAVALSPDGERVAYTERRWEPPAERRNTDLWVVDVDRRATARLTFDLAEEGSPVWSPDGRFIYFTVESSRAGEEQPPDDGITQVWRIAPGGGNPQPVARGENGVDGFDLTADGRSLFYTVGKERTDDEWKGLREKHDALIYGHGVTTFSQVWKLDLASWRAEKVVDERRVPDDDGRA